MSVHPRVGASRAGLAAIVALSVIGSAAPTAGAVGSGAPTALAIGSGAPTAGAIGSAAPTTRAIGATGQTGDGSATPNAFEPDSFTATRGIGVDVDVLANDVLGDAHALGPISITLLSVPTVGTATVEDSDGAGPALPVVRYLAPVGSALGAVGFEYAVLCGDTELGSASVSGTVVNAAPVARADAASVASAKGATRQVPVLANDSDADGGVLKVASVSTPAHGVATVSGNALTYDPTDGYIGTDRFDYRITDGQGGSATGTVTVSVTDSTTPMALRGDSLAAVAGRAVTLDVLANDASGGRDPLTVVAVGAARSGAKVSFGARIVTYTAATTFRGSDQFSYRVRDRFGNEATASVSVQVTAPPPPPATVQISVSGPLKRKDVRYSYRPGCPVRPSALRKMTMNYWDYSGKLRRGSLIVRRDAVADLTVVFTRAFDSGFRIKELTPVDTYYVKGKKKGKRSPTASDKASMAAGNTSAFNCRPVVGNPTKRSAHSYGIAIDINTFENPYVVGRSYYPTKAGRYLDRSPCRTGMICPGGAVATAMKDRGWLWGARWSKPDYQHFSATGG